MKVAMLSTLLSLQPQIWMSFWWVSYAEPLATVLQIDLSPSHQFKWGENTVSLAGVLQPNLYPLYDASQDGTWWFLQQSPPQHIFYQWEEEQYNKAMEQYYHDFEIYTRALAIYCLYTTEYKHALTYLISPKWWAGYYAWYEKDVTVWSHVIPPSQMKDDDLIIINFPSADMSWTALFSKYTQFQISPHVRPVTRFIQWNYADWMTYQAMHKQIPLQWFIPVTHNSNWTLLRRRNENSSLSLWEDASTYYVPVYVSPQSPLVPIIYSCARPVHP